MERVEFHDLPNQKLPRIELVLAYFPAIGQGQYKPAQDKEKRNSTFAPIVERFPDDVGKHHEHYKYKAKRLQRFYHIVKISFQFYFSILQPFKEFENVFPGLHFVRAKLEKSAREIVVLG